MKIPTPQNTEVEATEYEAYYVEETGRFVYRVPNPPHPSRPFKSVDKSQMKSRLAGFNYMTKGVNGMRSEVDLQIEDIIEQHSVDYMGPLAGHRAGFFPLHNRHILVTEDAMPMQPVPYSLEEDPDGECWMLVYDFLQALLPDPQFDYFVGWLKVGYEALLTGKFRPGQILALAGKSGVGKTFFQNLITLIFGRVAKPFMYLSGGTTFNSELFAAEHLLIGDELGSADYMARRNLGNKLKQLVAEPMHKYHAKGIDAFDLYPFWRCSMSFNYDAENVTVLPPMEESLREKMMIFYCHDSFVSVPDEWREDVWNSPWEVSLKDQLPYFLYWLTQIDIPDHLKHRRYGVVSYQDPEVLSHLSKAEMEDDFWDIVTGCLFEDTADLNQKEWLISSTELQAIILRKRPHLGNTKGMLQASNACGIQLRKIADKGDGRVCHVSRSTWKLCRVAENLWK